ncbi:chemokine-like factor [Denticeps clupeoides]|uniref:MARVEL domain-containing protein n=1 Tax=Denticeps clupeoides TaxID=299321 RepID=A0AAY4CMY2_9TELE|nr:chemokine-like factor [Denticeps clupeoides]
MGTNDGEPHATEALADTAFLKSLRGILKIAEIVAVFAALMCYAVACRPPYIAAACMEFGISLALLLLYVFKLNKRISLFFWPLIDVLNSFFAAALMLTLSLVAVSTDSLKATVAGAVVGFVCAGLWCTDGFLLFKKITFNHRRT